MLAYKDQTGQNLKLGITLLLAILIETKGIAAHQ
jgi:hypothetical protein